MNRFLFGAFGAVLPDIVLFESKRFTAPLLTFNLVQYVIVTVSYMLAAGVVAMIYPYRGAPTSWKAVVVGLSLPIIVSTGTAAADRLSKPEAAPTALRGPAPPADLRGEPPKHLQIPGTIIDLMAVF